MLATTNKAELSREITAYVEGMRHKLSIMNQTIHDNPETAWEEYIAHDTICDLFEEQGFQVIRSAYGIATAFEVTFGTGGRLINFNAEYDALPGIGHACGHNLIATASVTAFLAAAYILQKFKLPGRLQCLGTPAEELGGGKIPLLDAGAYNGATASLMVHPFSDQDLSEFGSDVVGVAGQKSLSIGDVNAAFHGVSAHAAAYPWDGVNALDAVMSSYQNISMLRQQMHPDERIHGCITEAPKISNAIPGQTKISYSYRSPTISSLKKLEKKVVCCIQAGALATGCSVDLSLEPAYADLVINESICELFQDNMANFGLKVARSTDKPGAGSTDQGNVSHTVPALHAILGIPCPEGARPHHPSFTVATGTSDAFERFLIAGKAMAMSALKILADDALNDKIHVDFAGTQKAKL